MIAVGVVLLAVAILLGAQPLDSGDNFCGNAFVSRGRNHSFNGCDSRLAEQRVFAGAIATSGVVVLGVAATRARQHS